MVMSQFGKCLTRTGELVAHPAAFGIVTIYAVLWFWFEPATFDWHAVATLSTWFMTLLIQRSGYRDTQALQAKLDELLRANTNARSELAALDNQEPEDIERHRAETQNQVP